MEPDTVDKVSQRNALHSPSGGAKYALVVGFSARALAEAVKETGFRVIAVDAFGDFDTRETAKVPQILSSWGAPDAELSLSAKTWAHYTEILRDQSAAVLPVFLAGGVENWPALLNRLHSFSELQVLGPSVDQMVALRNPTNWRNAVAETPVRFPEILPSPERGETGQEWLLKRTSSSGGLGVTQIPPDMPNKFAAGTYLQRRIHGRSIGASCIVSGESASPIWFIGATESWGERDWPAPTEFIYRGSFGPIVLSKSQQYAVCAVAQNLIASHAENYRGWIQMDFIEEPCGQLWLLEVNPRWTSGMEILRLSETANMAALHVLAFDGNPETVRDGQQRDSLDRSVRTPILGITNQGCVGKAVIYAHRDVLLTSELLEQLHSLVGRGFKDLPSAESMGGTISSGQPLLTVYAQTATTLSSEQQCRAVILERLNQQRVLVERLCDQY